jgi:hypothetical protein
LDELSKKLKLLERTTELSFILMLTTITKEFTSFVKSNNPMIPGVHFWTTEGKLSYPSKTERLKTFLYGNLELQSFLKDILYIHKKVQNAKSYDDNKIDWNKIQSGQFDSYSRKYCNLKKYLKSIIKRLLHYMLLKLELLSDVTELYTKKTIQKLKI